MILRLRRVMALDATGLHAREEFAAELRRDGARLILSGVHAQPLAVMERSGMLTRLPPEVHGSFAAALARARALVTAVSRPED